MSFEGLLIHTVDVTTVTENAGALNRYGDPADVTSVTTGVPCRIQPAGGNEILQDRDTRMTRFRIFFGRTAVVTGTSVLTWGTRTLKVRAEPEAFYDSSSLHHYEVDAEEVKG